ncbi:uncharacterized protein [Arachis hypogaea]|uniref:uncharacterized protein n=1 Tax=Arachis hypogaea TaxID=3818 RepID=UPI003B213013
MDDLRRDPNVENIDSEESEEDIVVLEETDISHGVKACTKSLTGRIFSAQKISAGTMENALSAIWDKPIGFRVVNQGTNQLQFFFDEEKDMRRIEKGSPSYSRITSFMCDNGMTHKILTRIQIQHSPFGCNFGVSLNVIRRWKLGGNLAKNWENLWR